MSDVQAPRPLGQPLRRFHVNMLSEDQIRRLHFLSPFPRHPLQYSVSRRVCSPTPPHRGAARGKWYKFNDNVVEEFDMNDDTLEYECFGGEYRPKVYDQCECLLRRSRQNRRDSP